MQKPNLQFEVKFLELKESGNRDHLFWTGNYVGTTTKINADKCVLVKPSVSVDPPVGMSNYFFDRNFLLDIGVQFTIDDDDANNGKKNTTDGVKRNKCKICRKQINCDKMRGHVGYHM